MNWIVTAPFVYPALEAAHIFGIALLVGSLFVFELRIWGLGAAVDARALGRLALPVTAGGFCLAATTGSIMFAAQATELIANQAFLLKMGLLLLAGLNALWFHGRGTLARPRRWARVQTAVSLGLWIGVIICGRWIAYR